MVLLNATSPRYPVYLLLCVVIVSGTPLIVDKETCGGLPDPIFLGPRQLPTTALASFQGSGNTWVRQILAGATGYKTGDVYISYGDDLYPEFTSVSNNSVIAIKTHTYSEWSTSDFQFERALVIVRHPLDALYSEFNRMYGGNKTGYADKSHLVNEDGSLSWKWDTWMTHITSWVDFYKYWITLFNGEVHIIYYNNLKQDPYNELAAAVKFLGLEPDIVRLNCTVKYPRHAYFKRTKAPPPVEKAELFKFSASKANQAITHFKSFVTSQFGEASETYKRLNLDISVEKFRG